jgi:hypothetical protein
MSRKRPYRSGQSSAEHFQHCAESPLLCNRGLRVLAVAVLPIPLAWRAAATACAAVQRADSVLNLVDPIGTGRWLVGGGWKAGLYEVGRRNAE